jgi:hypothetical protein
VLGRDVIEDDLALVLQAPVAAIAPSCSTTNSRFSGLANQVRTPSGVLLASQRETASGRFWWSSTQSAVIDATSTSLTASTSASDAGRTEIT